MTQDYVGSFKSGDTELLHAGVKGMKWGVRNDKRSATGSTGSKHLTNTKQLTKATPRRLLVTDTTLSPYRSAGRLRKKNPAPFSALTGKQQSKLTKSLARDRYRILNKKLPKTARGKVSSPKDYLKQVQNDPKVRNQQLRGHGTILKPGKRQTEIGESRKQYATTLSNYPRALTLGAKTNWAASAATYGLIGAMLLMGDDIKENDYLGVNRDDDLKHVGVKGMKWGVRRARGAAGTPSSAGSSKGGSNSATKTKDVVGKAKSSNVALAKQLVKDTVKGPESSIDKYNRLKKEVASGKANKLNDDDLKFLNSRAEALAKANKAFNQKGSWLEKTVKSAIDNAAQAQAKNAANLVAQKYVGDRIARRLTPTPAT